VCYFLARSILCRFNTFTEKCDVFDTFKKWKALVENETGKRLKCLKSDNGGEYCSKAFDDYFSYHRIRR
jgi:hypothetical protein